MGGGRTRGKDRKGRKGRKGKGAGAGVKNEGGRAPRLLGGGDCPGWSLNQGGVSWGAFVRGAYVRGGTCPGGDCPDTPLSSLM